MALIKCSECGKEVSEKATSCPHCGNPIKEGIQTVELTSKRWKKVKLFSWIAFIGGILIFLPNLQDGGFQNPMTGFGFSLANFGLIGIIIAKFGAWWSNR